MRRIILIVFLITLIFSCEKQVTDFCDSEECNTYFKIWKELIISRNQLSESYFNDHIFPYKTEIDSWNDGKSFRVEYKIKIDWAEANLSDQFIIWLDPSTVGLYPSKPTPRSINLSKSQINSLLDVFAFSSSIHKVAKIDHLKYTSREEAIRVLQVASGVTNLGQGEVSYENPGFNIDSGHPILRVSATINRNENRCLSGKINLVTGESEVRQKPCVIYFCFVKGTLITFNNWKSLPIEKLKINDKILSVNLETWSIEEDIVQKIDSVVHNNIVQLTFSDSTITCNTFDHPYFVKDKGWCSYKPSETQKNYNIKTKQLLPGDICFKIVNNLLVEVKVKTIGEKTEKIMTYNVSKLKKNKNYFANGILVSTEEY
jgi:hypothetical protein